MKKVTRILALVLAFALLLCCAVSAQEGGTSSQDAVNYKGKTNYEDIAEQLRADQTLDLNGLQSEMFKITGYAQGYNFDDAWFGSLAQMVNSGEQVILASGSSEFAFNFGGLPRTAEETDLRVGGIDSLTAQFADLLDGGVYTFCSGSHPSMIGPAIALLLRSLEGDKLVDEEGNPVYVPMSHVISHSREELSAVLEADGPGNYAYSPEVVSALMDLDYDTFMECVSNNQWEDIMAAHEAYKDTPVKELSKEYKIGFLRNDTTSDEALAYEKYLKELSEAMGFSVTISDSTDGNATNEANQISTWASAGFDAVISMSNGSVYDEAEACQSSGMNLIYYAVYPTGDDVEDLAYIDNYVGAVGPSKYNEAQAGYRLAKYYIEQGYTDFAVFGGSIMYGAEPHAYRVGGMFEAMIEAETGIQSTNFTE